MAKFTKQPAKIGDQVIMFLDSKLGYEVDVGLGFTAMKPYKVVATQNSKEKNRVCFKHVYPLHPRPEKFGVFIIDDYGDKRYVNLGTDCFGITVEKLCEKSKS
jgi:hypothetical protein